MMKYKIYEIVSPSSLKIIDDSGYNLTAIEMHVLQEVESFNYNSGLNDEHNSMVDAMDVIRQNKNDLKRKELTIIPIISINYEGVIAE